MAPLRVLCDGLAKLACRRSRWSSLTIIVIALAAQVLFRYSAAGASSLTAMRSLKQRSCG